MTRGCSGGCEWEDDLGNRCGRPTDGKKCCKSHRCKARNAKTNVRCQRKRSENFSYCTDHVCGRFIFIDGIGTPCGDLAHSKNLCEGHGGLSFRDVRYDAIVRKRCEEDVEWQLEEERRLAMDLKRAQWEARRREEDSEVREWEMESGM